MIDSTTILCLAARAGVCTKTAQRALEGRFIKGMAGDRVRRALAELGLGAPPTLGISSNGDLMAIAGGPHDAA